MAVSGMSGPVGAGLSYSRPLCDMNSALAMASWQYAIQIHLLNYRSRAGFQVTTCICEHRCCDGVSIDRWSCVSSDGRWWLRLSRPHRCHHSIEARWTWQPQLTALFLCRMTECLLHFVLCPSSYFLLWKFVQFVLLTFKRFSSINFRNLTSI